MKVNIKRVSSCPFCGGNVEITHGITGVQFLFFKCRACGAVISFDNDECNIEPERAVKYYERRTEK